MTDLAVAQANSSETAPHQLADIFGDWLRRLHAIAPMKRSACPPASELAGITNIDRYDIAPWLSF